ncbi:MAG: hypothetical protein ABW185_14600 [Sedimenticola sp.]
MIIMIKMMMIRRPVVHSRQRHVLVCFVNYIIGGDEDYGHDDDDGLVPILVITVVQVMMQMLIIYVLAILVLIIMLVMIWVMMMIIIMIRWPVTHSRQRYVCFVNCISGDDDDNDQMRIQGGGAGGPPPFRNPYFFYLGLGGLRNIYKVL